MAHGASVQVFGPGLLAVILPELLRQHSVCPSVQTDALAFLTVAVLQQSDASATFGRSTPPRRFREVQMTDFKIAVAIGSLRRDSINRTLALAIEKRAPPLFSFSHLSLGDLPLYSQDDGANPADAVKRPKGPISASQGLLFVTALYNRSMPGELKNAIDHASRPCGQSAWAGKPAGKLGASGDASGTCMAQQHLRNTLAYLDVPTLGQPEAFIQLKAGLIDASGEIGGSNRKFFQAWMDRYVAWIEKHAGSQSWPTKP